MKQSSRSFLSMILTLWLMFGFSGHARAVTALSATIDATANCVSNANLDLSWTGAGLHQEFGLVTDVSGNTIGTFGPDSSTNDTFNGSYSNSITTAQPAGRLIGSYAWIGSNPPSEATAAEFFVLYNCSTRVVIYRCFGAYGRCPKTAAAALIALSSASIPATSKPMLAAMMVLLALLGSAFLRRRTFSQA